MASRSPASRRSSSPPISAATGRPADRKSTRLNSSHGYISYAVFCLKKKKKHQDKHEAHKLNASTRMKKHNKVTKRRRNQVRWQRLDTAQLIRRKQHNTETSIPDTNQT